MSDIPSYYDQSDINLFEQFLTEDDYSRIKYFDNVYILPFVSRKSSTPQTRFGFGLARLMIRNLMLLRDISIHGPEDTPEVPCESVREMAEERAQSSYVTGIADNGEDEYSLKVELHRADQPVKSTRVRHEDFHAFLRECSSAIARLLDCDVDDSIADYANGGQRGGRILVQAGLIFAVELHHHDYRRQPAFGGRGYGDALDRPDGDALEIHRGSRLETGGILKIGGYRQLLGRFNAGIDTNVFGVLP